MRISSADFKQEAPTSISRSSSRETIEELMENYEMHEAQILKELYIQGALDRTRMLS